MLGLYIVAQPLLDLLTALGMSLNAAVTAGTVVRVLFLCFALAVTVTAPNFRGRGWCFAALAAMAVYLIAFLACMYAAGGWQLCRENLRDTGKLLYVPAAALLLITARRSYDARIPDWSVAGAGALYAVLILAAVLSGTSQYSYRTGFGYKGWFYAANEVSCILAIAGPVTLWWCAERLTQTRRRWYRILAAVLAAASVAFCASYLGTKIVFAVLALYALLAFVWYLVRALRSRRGAGQAAVAFVLLALTLLLFVTSPLNDYLDNVYIARMGLSSEEIAETWQSAPTDAAEGVTVGVNETAAAAAEASEGTWLRELIASRPLVQKLDKLLSRRLLNAAPAVEAFRSGPLLRKLFGVGYANAPCYGRRIDFSIELDGLSILIRHGVVGFLLFFLPYAAVIVCLIVGFFRRPGAILANLRQCTLLYSALAAFAISFLAGHVITAPAVGIFMLAVTAGALEPPEDAPREQLPKAESYIIE